MGLVACGVSSTTVASEVFSAPLAVPSVSITAILVFTGTTSPSLKRISERTPAAGEGISESTLSVEISSMTSSFATVSPGPLSHFEIVA